MQVLFPESQAKLTFTANEIHELTQCIPTDDKLDSRLIRYIERL